VRAHGFQREQFIARPLEEVFEFFAAAGNLERITPSWLRFKLLGDEPIEMQAGTLIEYRLRLHGIPLRWVTEIRAWEAGRVFVDRQLRGPYRLWEHRHEFAAVDGGTVVRDRVRYALPFGLLGEIAHRLFVRRDIERIFAFRNSSVARLLGSE
jgi:ligand-binding SRPBCC domain-containing protein